ncbi:MAG: DUF99 family protein [Candidatus Sericytochromatia bacterium]
MKAAAKYPMFLEQHKTFRVLGVDDTPFARTQSAPVPIAGVVCAGTRFEGMLWSSVTRDGSDANDRLVEIIRACKFYDQLHAVLIDGIALAGFNVVDLPDLAQRLDLPCLSVMRKLPDMPGIILALERMGPQEKARRLPLIEKAGPIFQHGPFCYQVQGVSPDLAGRMLSSVTDNGHVPEALRLAHLIGSAVATGQSSKRA